MKSSTLAQKSENDLQNSSGGAELKLVDPSPTLSYYKILLPVFLILLVNVLTSSLIWSLLPHYAQMLKASPLMIGTIFSVYAVGQFFSSPLLGQWSDRFGRKQMLLVSQLGTLVSLIVLAFANSLWLVFLSRIIDGITAGNVSLAMAYVSDHTTAKTRTKAFGKLMVALNLGLFLGPLVASTLIRKSAQAPIFVGAGFSFLSIMATQILLKNVIKSASPKKSKLFDLAVYKEFFVNKVSGTFLFQNFMFYMATYIYLYGLAMYAERKFIFHNMHFGVVETGYLIAYHGLMGTLMHGVTLSFLLKRLQEKKIIIIGFLAVMTGSFTLGLIENPMWYLLTAAITSIGVVIRPCITSLLSQHTDSNKQGSILGIDRSLASLAQIVAPAIGGFLINYHLLLAWAWAPAVFAAVGLWLTRNRTTSEKVQQG